MRIVTVQHRDFRGKTDYNIYETVAQLLADKPTATIAEKLSTAKTGDWIVSANGWVVPLLAIKLIEDKTIRGMGKPYMRHKFILYRVYHFPKQKVCIRDGREDLKLFNYNPKTNKNFAGDDIKCRLNELSPRKILFAQYVARGYDMNTALRLAYKNIASPGKLLKSLLSNDKLMDYLAKFPTPEAKALERQGLTNDYVCLQLKNYLDNPKTPTNHKLFALKIVYQVIVDDNEKYTKKAKPKSKSGLLY